MEVKIELIGTNLPYLAAVIELADANKNMLGFMPRSAMERAAINNQIMVAVTSDNRVGGYILFRLVRSKNRAAITHLCVDPSYRNCGIAGKLVNTFIEQTKELKGISLFCRRDYKSHEFWPHMGFTYRGEKPGRGRDKVPLTHYWYDHKHPDLFSIAHDHMVESRAIKAVIDANIFYNLLQDSQHPLLADWLTDDLALCLTPEIFNEINRSKDRHHRISGSSYAHSFPLTPSDPTQHSQILELLREYLPGEISVQDKSDLNQLSYAIAFEADFFVTNDQDLRKRLGTIVKNEFGVSIVNADDVIIFLDEFMNQDLYTSHRLAGSPIEIKRIRSGSIDSLADKFHRGTGVRKNHLRHKLAGYLAIPKTYSSWVISSQEYGVVGLVVLKEIEGDIMEINLLRVIEGPISSVLGERLIFWSISRAINSAKNLVVFRDDHVSKDTRSALRQNAFTKLGDAWIKFNLFGVLQRDQASKILDSYTETHTQYSIAAKYVQSLLDSIDDNLQQTVVAEKHMWPLKLVDANLPTYIVPIKPPWAIDLFDSKLGSQTLFGSDPDLMFRMENVYYRSAYTKIPTAPSRILWYVSKGNDSPLQGTMSIRASSYVEEVVIGTPKELFAKFSKLGVYKWKNVLTAANGDINKKILAFRFSHTELFDTPVSLSEWTSITQRKSAPQSASSLSTEQYLSIYEMGSTRQK